LAKFFRIARLCESAGYGFDKMLEWKHQTKNDVIFESTVDKTKFTFMLDTTKALLKNDTETDKKMEESVQKTTENYTENIKTAQKTVQKNDENYTENGKTAQKIILLMSENPSITKAQLSESIGISVSAISQQIAKLKKQGFIRREGADKGGKWIIIKTD